MWLCCWSHEIRESFNDHLRLLSNLWLGSVVGGLHVSRDSTFELPNLLSSVINSKLDQLASSCRITNLAVMPRCSSPAWAISNFRETPSSITAPLVQWAVENRNETSEIPYRRLILPVGAIYPPSSVAPFIRNSFRFQQILDCFSETHLLQVSWHNTAWLRMVFPESPQVDWSIRSDSVQHHREF